MVTADYSHSRYSIQKMTPFYTAPNSPLKPMRAKHKVSPIPLQPRSGHSGIGIRLQAMAEDGTSDGEQHLLPILPYRVFLTEAASPKKKGGNRYEIEMKKLADTSHREENFRATLSYAPSPLWFVLQPLPGLTEQADDNSTPSLLAAFLRKYPGRSHCVEESHVCCGHTSSTAKKRYSTIAPLPKTKR